LQNGLRLIEVDKDDLHDLGDIVDLISERPERFVVFCDDLSFEDGESGYKALKVALDGSVAAQSDNVVIYATSNRRHLLPEYMSDNETYKHTSDGEIHPGEVVEEKISLSERFGLWVSFYPFKQDDYLTIVGHWLQHFGCDAAEVDSARGDALVWALERGSRSGRVAWQFARDWSGGSRRHDGRYQRYQRRRTPMAGLSPKWRSACWCSRMGAICWLNGRQASLTKAIGNFRAASWSRVKVVEAALARELHEELGIEVEASHRWHTLEHDYPHAYVRLYFCKVTQWTGEPHGREGQAFVWQIAARRCVAAAAGDDSGAGVACCGIAAWRGRRWERR
jgi:8-oxo-dGTP pyrophosphatase MutT (NUDIX family)